MTTPAWFDPGAPLPKVFGIGMHKTSTTSLANALYTLGYHVGGTFDTGAFDTEADLQSHVVNEVDRYDALQDVPWSVFYRSLDERFPGSKFVLTVRDPDRWIRSVVTHFGRKPIATHEYIYGVPHAKGHEDVLLAYYERHNRDVEAYFADRPDDLVVMDITAGDGWDKLCPFLGLPEPAFAFPSQNRQTDRQNSRYVRVARRTLSTAVDRVGIRLDRVTGHAAVGAIDTYAAVNGLCRRFDAVVPPAGPPDDPDQRRQLHDMLRDWLVDHLAWAVEVDACRDPGSVRTMLDADRLDHAWSELRLDTRRWAGHLYDEGFGAMTPDGSDASDLVRQCLDQGIAHWNKIASTFDLTSYDPAPAFPLDRL
ncbi:MAG: sulfotransferase [Actinomycetota bacterium]